MNIPHAKIFKSIALLYDKLFTFSNGKDSDLSSVDVIDATQTVSGEVKVMTIKKEPIILASNKPQFIENAFAFDDKLYFLPVNVIPNLF